MSDSDPENLPDADEAATQSTAEDDAEIFPEACPQKPQPRLADDVDSDVAETPEPRQEDGGESDGTGSPRDLRASDEACRAEGDGSQRRSEGTAEFRGATDSISRARTRTSTGTRKGSGTGSRSRTRTGSVTRTMTGTRSGTADRDGGAEIILALVLQRNNIGVAVFNGIESILLWQQFVLFEGSTFHFALTQIEKFG